VGLFPLYFIDTNKIVPNFAPWRLLLSLIASLLFGRYVNGTEPELASLAGVGQAIKNGPGTSRLKKIIFTIANNSILFNERIIIAIIRAEPRVSAARMEEIICRPYRQ
jgi:hypothetical protein